MRKIVYFILIPFILSCSTDLSITMPEGPEGKPGNNGLSAYELWVQEVEKGTIAWNNETDIPNFFLYLKGEDGKDGQNGLSAHELWIIDVMNGIADPHNPGNNWDKNKISTQDFWYFLTGAKGKDGKDGQDGRPGQDGKPGQDGQNGQSSQGGQNGQNGLSAYELWVKEVQKGIEDPHNPGFKWDKNRTSLEDFWEYLRGADGKDGESGPGGDTGQPGVDTPIVLGKANVIAQFSNKANNEYVDWVTGSVTYIVYDDAGNPVAGAEVSGIPGIDPAKTFTSDGSGQITIGKDDLPVGLERNERFGSAATVTYTNSQGNVVTEESANNTYIPNKIDIRIRLKEPPYFIINDLNKNQHHKYMRVDCIVERKVDDKPWQQIPSYLGDLDPQIIALELNDAGDPTSFTTKEYYNGTSHNISQTIEIDIERPTKRCDYYKEASQPNLWDGNPNYVNIVLNNYYGETVHANSVIKLAPVQFVPLVKNLQAYSVESSGAFANFTGEFDMTAVDPSLFFEQTFLQETKNTGTANEYILYEPEVMSTGFEDIDNFRIKMSYRPVSGNAVDASNQYNLGTVNNPTFNLVIVHSESRIELHSHSQLFRSAHTTVGTIAPDGVNYLVKPSSAFDFTLGITYTP